MVKKWGSDRPTDTLCVNNSNNNVMQFCSFLNLTASVPAHLLLYILLIYLWGSGLKFFLYPFLNWSCLLYNVSLCGWLWRNHGMLYNDANFWFYIKRRDSQNKVRALTLYRAESLMLIAHSHFFILYSSSSFLPIRFSTYAISYATIGCWRNNDLD